MVQASTDSASCVSNLSRDQIDSLPSVNRTEIDEARKRLSSFPFLIAADIVFFILFTILMNIYVNPIYGLVDGILVLAALVITGVSAAKLSEMRERSNRSIVDHLLITVDGREFVRIPLRTLLLPKWEFKNLPMVKRPGSNDKTYLPCKHCNGS